MGALTSLATAGLNLALQSRAQQAERDELKRERDRQVRSLRVDEAQARREEDLALKRRIAQERARAGATGVGGIGGSIDAILKGLQEESALAQADLRRRTAERVRSLDERFGARQRRNLLDFNTQLLDFGSEALGSIRPRRRSLFD
jgi:hypothetical protein